MNPIDLSLARIAYMTTLFYDGRPISGLTINGSTPVDTLDTNGNDVSGTSDANLFDVTAMLVNVWDANFNMGAGIDTFSGSVLGDEVYGEGG